MDHLGVEKALIYLSLSINFRFWFILKFTPLKLSLKKVSENFCLGVYISPVLCKTGKLRRVLFFGYTAGLMVEIAVKPVI